MDKADSHRPHGAYNLSWKQVLPFEAVLRSADYWLLAFSLFTDLAQFLIHGGFSSDTCPMSTWNSE